MFKKLASWQIAGRYRDVDPFLFELIPQPIESLVWRDVDRAGMAFGFLSAAMGGATVMQIAFRIRFEYCRLSFSAPLSLKPS
jgi:hypothetical protein